MTCHAQCGRGGRNAGTCLTGVAGIDLHPARAHVKTLDYEDHIFAKRTTLQHVLCDQYHDVGGRASPSEARLSGNFGGVRTACEIARPK